METTNHDIAFIVRGSKIHFMTLSQNANPITPATHIARHNSHHNIMGLSFQPTIGLVVGRVDHLQTETQ